MPAPTRLPPALRTAIAVLLPVLAGGCQIPDTITEQETAAMTPHGMVVLAGRVTCPADTSLPPEAELRVRLVDDGYVHRPAGATPTRRVVAADSLPTVHPPPYPFTLRYAEDEIAPDHRYHVEAEVMLRGQRLLAGPKDFYVLTNARLGPLDLALTPADTSPQSSGSVAATSH